MPKAAELKRGTAVMINGQPHIIKHVDVQSPSARGAATLYKMRLLHAVTKQKLDHTFKGDDVVTLADLERRPVSFSYIDGESLVFMDDEDYSQYLLDADALGDDRDFLTIFKPVDGFELRVIIVMAGKEVEHIADRFDTQLGQAFGLAGAYPLQDGDRGVKSSAGGRTGRSCRFSLSGR